MAFSNSDKIISRIAPTPSGFLHLGNIVNFIYTWALVRKNGGILHLRIDDVDRSRVRNEFIEDIFASLEWLGLDVDAGPSSPEDFQKNYSQQDKREHYFALAKQLTNTYACCCSRKDIENNAKSGIYPQSCLTKGLNLISGQTVLRAHIPANTTLRIQDRSILLAETLGDFTVWRKDDMAAYQLASVADDEDMKTSLIVRGEDLFLSTAAQLFLAQNLSFKSFPRCRFVHHPLLADHGRKLAKSDNSLSLKNMREGGASRTNIFEEVGRFLNPRSRKPKTLKDFLQEEFTGELSWNSPDFPKSNQQ